MDSYFIGLMSGTSLDAADAALVGFSAGSTPRILATRALPPTVELRRELLACSRPRATLTLYQLGTLNQRLGDWFADAAVAVMRDADIGAGAITAIGSHGQTVWHAPDSQRPFSLQLGSASRIAARTGCTVVADFRNSDMAIGGQGAPLVPAFHRSLFASAERARIVINIGGFANLTILPAGSDVDASVVTGLDTGPGNALMDGWIQHHLSQPMDTDGRWATSGRVHEPLLARLLTEPYLSRPAPKSTGREYFNMAWLQGHLGALDTAPIGADVQATLCEFTARSIAMGVAAYGPGGEEILICGGGAHNPRLLARLQALLAPRPLATTTQHGMDVDWVEAAAFAWLAKRRLEGLPGNLAGVTGARSAAILGAVYAPAPA